MYFLAYTFFSFLVSNEKSDWNETVRLIHLDLTTVVCQVPVILLFGIDRDVTKKTQFVVHETSYTLNYWSLLQEQSLFCSV